MSGAKYGLGWWTYELPPAIEAYRRGGDLAPQHIDAIRAYLRKFIADPEWLLADMLRATVPRLTSRRAIARWLRDAERIGLRPL